MRIRIATLLLSLAGSAFGEFFESKCARVWTFRTNTAEVSQLLGIPSARAAHWLEVYVQHQQCAAPLDTLQFVELRVRYRTAAGQVRERRQILAVQRSPGYHTSAVWVEFDPSAVLIEVAVQQKFPEDEALK